jgi:hypothetical protein
MIALSFLRSLVATPVIVPAEDLLFVRFVPSWFH